MKTHFVNIYCNGTVTLIAVQATCLIEAQRKAVPAFRDYLKLKRAVDNSNKHSISFSN